MLNQFWGNKLSAMSSTQKVIWGILWLNMFAVPAFAQNSHPTVSFAGEASFDYSIPHPSSIMRNPLAQAIQRSGTYTPPTYPAGNVYQPKPTYGTPPSKPTYPTGGSYQPKPTYSTGGNYQPKPTYGTSSSKPTYSTGGAYQPKPTYSTGGVYQPKPAYGTTPSKPAYGIPQSKPIYPAGGVYQPKSLY